MPASLGFDTLIVNNRIYDEKSLSRMFEIFFSHDIKNYIFLSEFDFTADSFSLKTVKNKNFQSTLKTIAPRGVHTKICYNLSFVRGVSSNPDLRRIYSNRKHSSLFINLPTMLDADLYDSFAVDLNRLIYRLKAIPLCTSFDKTLETSDKEICTRLLQSPRLAFGFDLNYWLSSDNLAFAKQLSRIKPLFVPMLSNGIEAYTDIDYFYEQIMSNIGKDNYYALCTKINKCAALFGF